MTPEEAWHRLRTGTPVEQRAILGTLAENADARVTPAVAPLLHADDLELVTLAENTLWRVWSRSGDPAVDALFAEGLRAIEAQDWLGAVAAFSRVIDRAPTFAEGWNKRATALYLSGEFHRSLADCAEVIKRNPRHFGALSGAGLVNLELEQERQALDWFRRALEVNPNMSAIQAEAQRLEELLRGRSI
jgi:tetratricopeptide (TPR) repeat protein